MAKLCVSVDVDRESGTFAAAAPFPVLRVSCEDEREVALSKRLLQIVLFTSPSSLIMFTLVVPDVFFRCFGRYLVV